MKSPRFFIGGLGLTLVTLLSLSQWGFAGKSDFDLYSWPKENSAHEWCYVLFPSTKDALDVAAIKKNQNQVCGNHNVKRLMGQTMPEGAKVYWKSIDKEGLTLPTSDIVNDLGRFCSTMDFKLVLPKDSPQAKRGDPWN